MLALQRNATRGRRIAGTCHMHEDGAAGAPHARHPVMVQHDDDVVRPSARHRRSALAG